MTDWVRCSDRMPEVDQIVLIRGCNGMFGVARAADGPPSGCRWWDPYSIIGYDWSWAFEDIYGDDPYKYVTHWAPCPEQPGDV